jgi:methylenetetrahydrofolate dehydrogenase (NADP+)/methenyltetrahydrofolate cyclohydrolase
MTAVLLDGNKIAQKIREELKKEVEALNKRGILPSLSALQVGQDPGSAIYIRSQKRPAKR